MERGYGNRMCCGTKTVSNSFTGGFFMIYVGIDVAKDKHDCFIMDSDGTVSFQIHGLALWNCWIASNQLLDHLKM